MKLGEILAQIRLEQDYKELIGEADQLIYEQNVELGEVLNPNSAYNYVLKPGFKTTWEFTDKTNNIYFVRMAYQPTTVPYWELKTGYYGPDDELIYDPNVPPIAPGATMQDVHTRGDTVAKIFRDEIMPYFMNQNLTDRLIIKPIDIKRYQFTVRLINKFVDSSKVQIVFNKPHEVVIIKPNQSQKL